MGRPEIMRSGEVSLGDNPAGNEVDDKESQSTDTIGSVPPGNRADGHVSDGNDDDERGDENDDDPDKPLAKFAERAERERKDAAAKND